MHLITREYFKFFAFVMCCASKNMALDRQRRLHNGDNYSYQLGGGRAVDGSSETWTGDGEQGGEVEITHNPFS